MIVQEVERTYLSKLNVNEVFSAIREAVALHHALQVYAIALIKPGASQFCKGASQLCNEYKCSEG